MRPRRTKEPSPEPPEEQEAPPDDQPTGTTEVVRDRENR